MQVVMGLTKFHNVSQMFGRWLRGFSKVLNPLILLGADATRRSLRCSGNDIVSKKKKKIVQLLVKHWLDI